jgi:hypothetical protein
VKPVRSIIIICIIQQAFIDIYCLLRPGEYMGTTSDDTPFHLQEVLLRVGNQHLDTMLSSAGDIQPFGFVLYTVTTQKNGTKGEFLIIGLSADA